VYGFAIRQRNYSHDPPAKNRDGAKKTKATVRLLLDPIGIRQHISAYRVRHFRPLLALNIESKIARRFQRTALVARITPFRHDDGF